MSNRDLVSLSDLVGGIGRLLVSRGRLVPKALKILGERDGTKRESIGTLLERNAIENPTQPAVKFGEREISHHEFNAWVNRYANYWISRGLKKGDVAAVFMENRPELLVTVAALAKIGAIAGMINTQQRKHVLVHSFTTCKPKIYVVGEELREPFEEVRAELGEIPEGALYFSPDAGDRVHGVRVVFPPPRIEDLAPAGYVDIECASQDSLATNPKTTREVQLQDPCFYIFTSGTTGLPKASIMTHFRWVKAGGIMGMAALHLGIEDTLYAPLPLYHNQALTTSWASTATTGACLAIRRRFSASQFWEDARTYNATAFTYIGEVCPYLLAQAPHDDDRNHSITRCMGVGMRPEIWHEFKRRFGIDEIYEFYAASECNVAFINLLNFDRTVGVCPLPYALVKFDIDAGEPVLGPDGFMQRVGKGEAGLLIAEVSEKAKFDGYTDPAASEKKLFRNVFKAGDVWYNSGDLLKDLGYKHAQFVDRVGDTFRWKSENVSTTEVEQVLNAFEQVKESTVYGVEVQGQPGRAGMAAIVPEGDPSQFDFKALTTYLREQLPAYAVPVFVRFVDSLEVTGTFKHRKVELRNEGYDPAQVKEAPYVLFHGATQYEPITPEMYHDIRSGQHRL